MSQSDSEYEPSTNLPQRERPRPRKRKAHASSPPPDADALQARSSASTNVLIEPRKRQRSENFKNASSEEFVVANILPLLPSQYGVRISDRYPPMTEVPSGEKEPPAQPHTENPYNIIVGSLKPQAGGYVRTITTNDGEKHIVTSDVNGTPVELVWQSQKPYAIVKDLWGRPVKAEHVFWLKNFNSKEKREFYIEQNLKDYQAWNDKQLKEWATRWRRWRCQERSRQFAFLRAEWKAGNTMIFRPGMHDAVIDKLEIWVFNENHKDFFTDFFPVTYNGRQRGREFSEPGVPGNDSEGVSPGSPIEVQDNSSDDEADE